MNIAFGTLVPNSVHNLMLLVCVIIGSSNMSVSCSERLD